MKIEEFEEILPAIFKRWHVVNALILIWICRTQKDADLLAGKLLSAGMKSGSIISLGENSRQYQFKKKPADELA